MQPVTLTLHGGLRDLARRPGAGPLQVPVPHPRSTKDAVESLGVPHTEVGAVTVGAVEVGWDHRLAGGEALHVYPPGPLPDGLTGRVRPAPPRPVRVVADVHLGALARRLRLVGIDTLWRNDADDPDLVAWARQDDRVLLTRDRGLLMRRRVVHGALVHADVADEQLVEVVDRLDLRGQLDPGGRCPRCNGVVVPAPPDEVVDELLPGTRAAGHDRFTRCRACRQLYWPGAHAPAITTIVDRVR